MTTVLISGGNRGYVMLSRTAERGLTLFCSLGLGMVERYAKRENYTVIATARDPKSMPKVQTGSGSKVIVVTMDQGKPKGCLEVSLPCFA